MNSSIHWAALPMHVVLFEDHVVPQLYPITLGRPAYAMSCGGSRLVDLAECLGGTVLGVVRPHLLASQREDYSLGDPNDLPAGQDSFWINARVVPSEPARAALEHALRTSRPGIARAGQQIVAAYLPSSLTAAAIDVAWDRLDSFFGSIGIDRLKPLPCPVPLLNYPHDLIRCHAEILCGNLQRRMSNGKYVDVSDGVFAAEGATLGEYVVTETSAGPIVLDEGASVGPYSYLRGPLLVERDACVLEHSSIKDGVTVGCASKVGGEVEASIIEPHTNKKHFGFLGHSYLGSWINLGAGTSNSDLKNTYGEIKMQYGQKKIGTGSQFMGCIVGDYVKSAINTAIMTGKTIGPCSMLYGYVTTNVPSFVNYARSFGQLTEIPPEIAVETQKRMFQRRRRPHRPSDGQLVRDMFELTCAEREASGRPLTRELVEL